MYNGYAVARTHQAGCVWTIPEEVMNKLKINKNQPVTLLYY